MSITSTDFHSRNNVLNSFNIVPMLGWTVTTGNVADGQDPSTAHNVGTVDGIDINGNGVVDNTAVNHPWRRTTLSYTEPVLATSLNDIKKFAAQTGTQVITANDTNQLMLENWSYELAGSHEQQNITNLRSIATLVPLFAPLNNNATWAIDLSGPRAQVLITTPK